MSRRSLSKLSAKELLARLQELASRERGLTVEILEVLMEADWRRLWARAGYSSMDPWCMAEFGWSEDKAAKRSCAARQARRYPLILEMIADGRLHLSGLIVLARKLKEAPERARALLAASSHRSRRAIETMLAERFPQADVPTQVVPMPAPDSPAPGRVNGEGLPASGASDLPAPGRVNKEGPSPETAANGALAESSPAPGRVDAASYSRVTPTARQRYAVQFTMDEAMHADLVRVQELPGPQEDGDRVTVSVPQGRVRSSDRARTAHPPRDLRAERQGRGRVAPQPAATSPLSCSAPVCISGADVPRAPNSGGARLRPSQPFFTFSRRIPHSSGTRVVETSVTGSTPCITCAFRSPHCRSLWPRQRLGLSPPPGPISPT